MSDIEEAVRKSLKEFQACYGSPVEIRLDTDGSHRVWPKYPIPPADTSEYSTAFSGPVWNARITNLRNEGGIGQFVRKEGDAQKVCVENKNYWIARYDGSGDLCVECNESGTITWNPVLGYFLFHRNKEEQMYVFGVIVVDKESDEIVYDGKLVASTGEQAKMLALADIMRESAPTDEVISNYHFVTVKIGEGYSK